MNYRGMGLFAARELLSGKFPVWREDRCMFVASPLPTVNMPIDVQPTAANSGGAPRVTDRRIPQPSGIRRRLRALDRFPGCRNCRKTYSTSIRCGHKITDAGQCIEILDELRPAR